MHGAQARGAEFRHACVTGLERRRGRLAGVRLETDLVQTEAACIAMGPWSRQASGWLGIDMPVVPLKGQILRLQMPVACPETRFSDAEGNYMARKADALIYVGTTEERVGCDETTTPEAKRLILRQAARYVSGVATVEVVVQTACLRPLSPDGLPILGAVPGLTGAFIATGHGCAGLLLAPGSAMALAAEITGDEPPGIDLSPFDPGRFN